MQQNFFYNPANSLPPGLTKKQSSGFPHQNQTNPQDHYQNASTMEKLNHFLNDPAMRQLLKDIINHTNVHIL